MLAQVARRLDALLCALSDACLWIAALVLFALLLLGAIDVVLINLMNAPVPSAIELTEAGHVMLIFMSLAAIQQRRQNIVVDIFTTQMGPRMRIAGELVALSCGLLVFSLIAWRAIELAAHSMAIREIASSFLRFPVYPVKVVMAFGAVLVALQFLRQIVRLVLGVDGLAQVNSSGGERA